MHSRPWERAQKLLPLKYEEILKLVGEMLKQAHYQPQDINDDFSKKIFKKYFDDLDPEKNIFLQSDMEAQKKYETRSMMK